MSLNLMPDWDWQLVISIACVLWATAMLLRGVIRFWQGQHGSSCGSGACGDCPAEKTSPAPDSPRDIIPLQPMLPTDGTMNQTGQPPESR